MAASDQGADRITAMRSAHDRAARKSSDSTNRADPRANQRERTRAAIMDATRKLLRKGTLPSIADAAQEARVSRATAYRYFPSQGALIQEAITSALVSVQEWEELLADADELPTRVEQLATTMFELMQDNEALLRGALLLSLQQWARTQAGEALNEQPIKRGGRLGGIHVALEPFQATLDPSTLRRLAIAISMFMGIEARILLQDIWDLEEDEARQVTLWATRMLARAAVEESKSSGLTQE